VISVNVGAIEEVRWRGEIVTTAIWKHPVEGRVAIRGVNLDGDDQADREVHGGKDKAVYAYAREDYEAWRDRHGVDALPGLFGENLTVEGIDLVHALVGERWEVGTTLAGSRAAAPSLLQARHPHGRSALSQTLSGRGAHGRLSAHHPRGRRRRG
jgi:MOSC domain-containing protein YiiM